VCYRATVHSATGGVHGYYAKGQPLHGVKYQLKSVSEHWHEGRAQRGLVCYFKTTGAEVAFGQLESALISL